MLAHLSLLVNVHIFLFFSTVFLYIMYNFFIILNMSFFFNFSKFYKYKYSDYTISYFVVAIIDYVFITIIFTLYQICTCPFIVISLICRIFCFPVNFYKKTFSYRSSSFFLIFRMLGILCFLYLTSLIAEVLYLHF